MTATEPATEPVTAAAKGLYDAILADPWDDGARLIYADEIEEREPERAEFIRVQIGLANTPEPDYKTIGLFWTKEPPWWADAHGCVKCRGWYTGCDDGFKPCKYHALHFREKELWIAHGREWFAEALDFIPVGDSAKNYISRGFPHSVSLTLAKFWGGACENCRGNPVPTVQSVEYGDDAEFHYHTRCHICHGIGHIPGLVESLAARWPVTEIRLVDREPSPNSLGGPIVAWQHDTTEGWMDSHIPYKLLVQMAKSEPEGDLDGRTWLTFPDRESALAALSRACIDESRARAGLPGLNFPNVAGHDLANSSHQITPAHSSPRHPAALASAAGTAGE